VVDRQGKAPKGYETRGGFLFLSCLLDPVHVETLFEFWWSV